MPTFLIFFSGTQLLLCLFNDFGANVKSEYKRNKRDQVICFLISLHCNCMGLIKERVQNETKKGCYKNKLLLFGTPETAS